ncbi:MAG: RpiB/LacA/LacB family sugar-phosphate isomerase, partial [Patescibacteria group bacterium]|nr:RpiB/LacA/LacB family sugar-phosphate isomerase [Patescibacteria group bacterium]
MRVAVGSDHRGVKTRGSLVELLGRLGQDVVDVGTHTPDDCDYPDIAEVVARMVANGEADRGILICGSGLGMC